VDIPQELLGQATDDPFAAEIEFAHGPDHSGRCHSAEKSVAFHQQRPGSESRGRGRRHQTGRSTAANDDIDTLAHRDLAARFAQAAERR